MPQGGLLRAGLLGQESVAETAIIKYRGAIAQSSIAAINKSHSAGDLFRLYLLAKRDGADFNLAAIPATFSQESKQPFDRQYMQALFDAGVAQRGARWFKEPPELSQTERQVSR
jgi:hypothetical protein